MKPVTIVKQAVLVLSISMAFSAHAQLLGRGGSVGGMIGGAGSIGGQLGGMGSMAERGSLIGSGSISANGNAGQGMRDVAQPLAAGAREQAQHTRDYASGSAATAGSTARGSKQAAINGAKSVEVQPSVSASGSASGSGSASASGSN